VETHHIQMNFAQPQYQSNWNLQNQGSSFTDSFLSFESNPTPNIPYQYPMELSHKAMNFHASKPQLAAQRPPNTIADSKSWAVPSQSSARNIQSNVNDATLEQKTSFLDSLIAQQTKAINEKSHQEEERIPFWRSQEGQDLLESAGINGEPWWEEPRQPVHPGFTREPNEVDYMMQNTRKMLKREISEPSQQFQNVFKYPTIENHDFVKQGLMCQNNPSFESTLMSTDESEQSQLTGSPRDHENHLANFISKSNTPSERGGGVPKKRAPKGAKAYFPGMILGRVKSSVKDFLERYNNRLSESERMRFRYIHDIFVTGVLRNESEKKEFMAFLKTLKSMQAFDSIEESFRSARPYAIILLKFVYSFLSQEGSIDLEDWFSHGRINGDNQAIIRDNKDWYKSEFLRIERRMMA